MRGYTGGKSLAEIRCDASHREHDWLEQKREKMHP